MRQRAAQELHSLAVDLRVFSPDTADDLSPQQAALAELVWEFQDIFSTDPRIVLANSDVEHSINTGKARPIRSRPYRRSPHERAIIARCVEKMKADGAIRDCSSPWASQVVLVSKPDGSWRFCVDYSKIGKVTTRDCYPLPRIETILDATEGSTWFSTHDLSSGYWQTAMCTRVWSN